MSDIITTLHPENDDNTNLYPNVKKENIPSGSIDRTKLGNDVNSLLDSINALKPSGTDTSAHILVFESNKGIYVATDNGHWYYWNGTQYADGGVYQTAVNYDELEEKLTNQVGVNWLYTKNVVSGTRYPLIDIIENFSNGEKIWCKPFKYTGNNLSGTNKIDLYGYETLDGAAIHIQSFTNLDVIHIVTLDRNYAKLRYVFNINASESIDVEIGAYNVRLNDTLTAKFAELTDIVNTLNTKKNPNILILGDSYSAQNRWINQMNDMIHIRSIVNLAVSSATMKNKFSDMSQYPYTDRPSADDGWDNNYNTFGSQIAKMERLIAGTDLDEGETKIYENVADRPDIIIIEGGKNDSVDSSTDNYINAIYTSQQGYWKQNAASEVVSQGWVKIPTPYWQPDRTTFAGAMRYLFGKLHGWFPNAMIFFITPSGLSYAYGGLHNIEKSNQIKKFAEMLCVPVIDWTLNGRNTYALNNVSGSGTENDPWISSEASELTIDSLHPNDKGAKYLAEEVVKVLHNYNLVSYKN